jgi:hypothetical protein
VGSGVGCAVPAFVCTALLMFCAPRCEIAGRPLQPAAMAGCRCCSRSTMLATPAHWYRPACAGGSDADPGRPARLLPLVAAAYSPSPRVRARQNTAHGGSSAAASGCSSPGN